MIGCHNRLPHRLVKLFARTVLPGVENGLTLYAENTIMWNISAHFLLFKQENPSCTSINLYSEFV